MSVLRHTPPLRVATPVAARGLRETTSLLSWRVAVAGFLLVIWLVPIKAYKLPVRLPFNLEVYRLLVLVLGVGFAMSLAGKRLRLSAGAHGTPLVVIVLTAIASLILNIEKISEEGLQTQAIKSLSFFVSFIIIYLLIASTVQTLQDAHVACGALVVGALIVAISAMVESRTRYNVFAHLHEWIPVLDYTGLNESVRAGRLRVRGSAQHPIALAVALTMCVPLAFYLSRHAATVVKRRFWLLAGLAIATAAFATISRTVVLMTLTMFVVGLMVRREVITSKWPLLLVLPFVLHFAAPGSMKTLYHAFLPEGGLIAEQTGRAGSQGSGRVADLGPGLRLWQRSPLVGGGLGTAVTRGDDKRVVTEEEAFLGLGRSFYFDNQYMVTLVTLGVAGLIGVFWFVWGAVRKLVRSAKRFAGGHGDLLAACAISCAGFGVSMFTFDAFAFVQAALLFFIIAALGLRIRANCEEAAQPLSARA